MMSNRRNGPPYPVRRGSKISGDPTSRVRELGSSGRNITSSRTKRRHFSERGRNREEEINERNRAEEMKIIEEYERDEREWRERFGRQWISPDRMNRSQEYSYRRLNHRSRSPLSSNNANDHGNLPGNQPQEYLAEDDQMNYLRRCQDQSANMEHGNANQQHRYSDQRHPEQPFRSPDTYMGGPNSRRISPDPGFRDRDQHFRSEDQIRRSPNQRLRSEDPRHISPNQFRRHFDQEQYEDERNNFNQNAEWNFQRERRMQELSHVESHNDRRFIDIHNNSRLLVTVHQNNRDRNFAENSGQRDLYGGNDDMMLSQHRRDDLRHQLEQRKIDCNYKGIPLESENNLMYENSIENVDYFNNRAMPLEESYAHCSGNSSLSKAPLRSRSPRRLASNRGSRRGIGTRFKNRAFGILNRKNNPYTKINNHSPRQTFTNPKDLSKNPINLEEHVQQQSLIEPELPHSDQKTQHSTENQIPKENSSEKAVNDKAVVPPERLEETIKKPLAKVKKIIKKIIIVKNQVVRRKPVRRIIKPKRKTKTESIKQEKIEEESIHVKQEPTDAVSNISQTPVSTAPSFSDPTISVLPVLTTPNSSSSSQLLIPQNKQSLEEPIDILPVHSGMINPVSFRITEQIKDFGILPVHLDFATLKMNYQPKNVESKAASHIKKTLDMKAEELKIAEEQAKLDEEEKQKIALSKFKIPLNRKCAKEDQRKITPTVLPIKEKIPQLEETKSPSVKLEGDTTSKKEQKKLTEYEQRAPREEKKKIEHDQRPSREEKRKLEEHERRSSREDKKKFAESKLSKEDKRKLSDDKRAARKEGVVKVGFWNVSHLNSINKPMEYLLKETKYYEIDVFGLSKLDHKKFKLEANENVKLITSAEVCTDESSHCVAMLIGSRMASNLISWQAVSDRIIMSRFKYYEKELTIVQVYAPRKDDDVGQTEVFYFQLNMVLQTVPISDIIIAIGDFDVNIVNRFGNVEPSSNCKHFTMFCAENKLIDGIQFLSNEYKPYLKTLHHITISEKYKHILEAFRFTMMKSRSNDLCRAKFNFKKLDAKK